MFPIGSIYDPSMPPGSDSGHGDGDDVDLPSGGRGSQFCKVKKKDMKGKVCRGYPGRFEEMSGREGKMDREKEQLTEIINSQGGDSRTSRENKPGCGPKDR